MQKVYQKKELVGFLFSGGQSNKCSNICSEHPSMRTPLTVASWAPMIPCPYGQHEQRVSATRRELPTKTRAPQLPLSPLPVRGSTVPSQRSRETRGHRPITPGFSPPAWGSGPAVAAGPPRPVSRSQLAGAGGQAT